MRCLIKTPRLLSISYLYLNIHIVIFFVSSLSLGVLTLVYLFFTPYRLALVLVSKSGGAGDCIFESLRLISNIIVFISTEHL